jgi:hypothetical protein
MDKKEVVVKATEEEAPFHAGADQKLEEAKGNFVTVVTIGVKPNGAIDVLTNIPTYEMIQALLSRTSFEMHIHQRSADNQSQSQETN